MNDLSPSRQVGETQVDYRERRRRVKERLDKYLAGRLIHESSVCVKLPGLGEDDAVDEAVRRGLYRRIVALADKAGKAIRLACTKGITYRKEKAA